MFNEVGWPALRSRSMVLTGLLEASLLEALGDSVEILTPSDPQRRGAQLSVRITGDGARVEERLAEAGVVIDFRPPDVLRFAPTPLYNTVEDIERAVAALAAEVS